MTIKEAKAILRPINITLRERNGEFSVNFNMGTEETAYYTDDLTDAVGTAQLMRYAGEPSKQRDVLRKRTACAG